MKQIWGVDKIWMTIYIYKSNLRQICYFFSNAIYLQDWHVLLKDIQVVIAFEYPHPKQIFGYNPNAMVIPHIRQSSNLGIYWDDGQGKSGTKFCIGLMAPNVSMCDWVAVIHSKSMADFLMLIRTTKVCASLGISMMRNSGFLCTW